MKNKIVLKIILFFIAFVNIFIIQNKVFAVDMEQITYFEDIGKYSIAIAGNNNACRGTASYQGFYLIKDYLASASNTEARIYIFYLLYITYFF